MGLFSFLKKNDDDAVKDMIRPIESDGALGDGNGSLVVDDVFTISGRGVVVTGRVEAGSFQLNDSVKIIKEDNEIIDTQITGIESFRKILDVAEAGDNVGLLLSGIKRDQIQRGDRIE